MVYFDTSALVPLFILEPKSKALIDWLESSREPVVISEWAIVEFAAAMSMKVRMAQVSSSRAGQARNEFESFAQRECRIFVPDRESFRQAAALASDPKLKLRAGDALHLAIARLLNSSQLACLDDAMVASAKSLDLEVLTF